MGAKPSRSHWPTVSPAGQDVPHTLTCTWSHGERGTGSVGERPVSFQERETLDAIASQLRTTLGVSLRVS